jgi:hypothetical protein
MLAQADQIRHGIMPVHMDIQTGTATTERRSRDFFSGVSILTQPHRAGAGECTGDIVVVKPRRRIWVTAEAGIGPPGEPPPTHLLVETLHPRPVSVP